jgi:hypothetical protein
MQQETRKIDSIDAVRASAPGLGVELAMAAIFRGIPDAPGP